VTRIPWVTAVDTAAKLPVPGTVRATESREEVSTSPRPVSRSCGRSSARLPLRRAALASPTEVTVGRRPTADPERELRIQAGQRRAARESDRPHPPAARNSSRPYEVVDPGDPPAGPTRCSSAATVTVEDEEGVATTLPDRRRGRAGRVAGARAGSATKRRSARALLGKAARGDAVVRPAGPRWAEWSRLTHREGGLEVMAGRGPAAFPSGAGSSSYSWGRRLPPRSGRGPRATGGR